MGKEENLKNGKPFKKGDPRINTKGRPKGSRNRKTIVRKWLEAEEEFKNPFTGETEIVQQADIMVLGLLKKARKGDVAAFKELMDSGYGKLMENYTQINYEALSDEDLQQRLEDLDNDFDREG